MDDFIKQYLLAVSYIYLKEMGRSEERIRRFHEGNIGAFWRQIVPSSLQEIEKAIRQGGAAGAETRFREMLSSGKGSSFEERERNQFGYELLNSGHSPTAIAVFRRNVTLFPKSANVYDSLGEALAATGNLTEAIQNYRQVSTIDPANQNAGKKLKELQEVSGPR
jgi:tetratricopeptide (TPR) repeat protein